MREKSSNTESNYEQNRNEHPVIPVIINTRQHQINAAEQARSAVEYNDIQGLQEIVNAGVYLNQLLFNMPDSKDMQDPFFELRNQKVTLLHIAVAKEALESVKYLVENKLIGIHSRTLGIYSTEGLGSTPLRFALKAGNIEISKFLIENGATFNEDYSGPQN